MQALGPEFAWKAVPEAYRGSVSSGALATAYRNRSDIQS
jgi:hypothetical protein